MHESYRLVINDSARSNHIESATQQWRKSAAPIRPEYQPLPASLMAPVRATTLEKSGPQLS